MLTLYQAEWCPHSHKVRQRLTELGVDFLARQVAAEPRDRHQLWAQTGESEIPVLVLADGTAIAGEEAILAYLDRRLAEDADSERDRARADEKTAPRWRT